MTRSQSLGEDEAGLLGLTEEGGGMTLEEGMSFVSKGESERCGKCRSGYCQTR